MLSRWASNTSGASASTAARLLPRYDQWVLGPGTADPAVVPPAIRAQVSRGANVLIVGGVVSGTWAVRDDRVVVTWAPAGTRPRDDAAGEAVARLASALGRSLELDIDTADGG